MIMLTHSPPQPPIDRFCFESLIPRTANWWVRLSSSGSPEQPFGGLTLLAVFKLMVTILVKIIKYDDRLVFVLLIYAEKTEWSQRKILRKPSSNTSVHSLKMYASAWPFSDSSDDESLNFLGFSAEELNQAHENFVRGSRDTDSDLSIEDYTSSEEEASDSDASLTDEDRPVVRPLPQGWTDQLTPSVIEDFVDNAGPTTILSGDKREIDFFQLLFTENLFSLIANETNKHADQTQKKKGQNDNKWHRMDTKEIRAFIGMRIYMSIVNLPNMKMYWCEDQFFGNFGIADVMTRGRFDKLCQYFHVNDRTGYDRRDPNRDKLQLVQSVLDVVSCTCFDNYVAHKENSIDEAMIKFRGTLAFRQYLPAKPTKYRTKVWVRVDSTNGYACQFQVYAGCPPGVKTEVGLGKHVVLELTKELIGTRSHIYLMIILTV